MNSRKSLSSDITFFLKFVAAPFMSLFVISVCSFLIIGTVSSSGEAYMERLIIPSLFAVFFLAAIFYSSYRIYFIEYDNQFVYVRRYWKEQTFPLQKVRRVNEPYSDRDKTYELEMEPFRGSSDKFDFIPIGLHVITWWNQDYPQSIKDFMYRVKQIKESQRIKDSIS